MKKIISPRIEKLRAFRKERRGNPATGGQLLGVAAVKQLMLQDLLEKHPALDYADTLLAMVRLFVEEHCRRHCTTFTPSFHTDDCKKAQALINEIEEKK